MDYGRWGFRSSPFEQSSLPPSELGSRLLVGRDAELHKIEDRLEPVMNFDRVRELNFLEK